MRAIWKGSISFGLANIPVRLFSATSTEELNLDMLHEKDHSPIRYARVCRKEEKEVPYDQIVKGYKLSTGEYVILSDEDFKKADIKKTSTISVVEFVKEEEIPSVYYEKPYFLAPEKGAEKVYALFRESLFRSKKVGIARFVLRNREHLAAILPGTEAIILNQLRFESELRNVQELDMAIETVEDAQVEMAMALINQLTRVFNSAEFKDTYIGELKALIKKKAEGKEIKVPAFRPEKTKSMDEIMRALKESIEKEKQKA